MPSFLICYPDVPANAMVVSTSAATHELYPIENSFYGERWAFTQRATNGTSFSITYDLGTGNFRTVDHLIIAGCQSLRANSVTECRLQGSTDGVTWVNQLGTATNFLSRSFMGPDGDDIIFTQSVNDEFGVSPSSYLFWRLILSGSASHVFSFGKIYFGTSFDLTKEPDYFDMTLLTEKDSDTWRYPRGQVIMSKAFYPKHRFIIEWDGLSDSTARSVMTTLLHNPFRDHVFLYTGTYHDPLYDNRLIHARIITDGCSISRKKDSGNWVDLAMEFEEV